MGFAFDHQHLLTSDLLFGGVSDFLFHNTGGNAQLYASVEASGNIAQLDLTFGQVAQFQTPAALPEWDGPMRVNDLELLGTGLDARLLAGGVQTSQIESTSMNSLITGGGILGGQQSPINQIAPIQLGTSSFIAAGSRDHAGLDIFEQTAPTTWTHRDHVENHAKVSLSDTADLLSIDVEGTPFLISGATGDGAISTFGIGTDGTASLIDTIGVKQQLWLSGIDDLVGVEAAGVDYVAIAATNSSSVSLVRINASGVMFVEDHITDDQNSRFANVDALDSFEIGNRGFLVAAGSDDGVTLLEVMPDGQFFEHTSLANRAGGGLEDVTALQAAVMGGEVQVFAGTQTGDIVQLNLGVSNLGAAQLGTDNADTLTGSTSDDLLYGGAGNDTLSGGTEDDLLAGGGGTDHMTGGAGADVFVFGTGSRAAQVTDFNSAEDHVDLSDWGRLYHISSLNITSRNGGADIRFGDQLLELDSYDNSRLDAETLSDSFLF